MDNIHRGQWGSFTPTPTGHPPQPPTRSAERLCVHTRTSDDERVIRVRRKVISAQGAIRIIILYR